jgi:uncharacterized protein YecA (UPF0149 family)
VIIKMNDYKMSDILPLLKQFGISPEQLGPERLNKLMKFAPRIQDPSQITPELSAELMQLLGVSSKPPSKPRQSTKKIGRNDPCPCKSGKKWKKCCLNNHT